MRRRLLVLSLVAASVLGLSGCFPLLVAGGAAGAALVAADRRTSGAYLDDQAIDLKASSQIRTKLPSAHVNVASYNRAVLLTGEVPSEEARAEAVLLARAQPNVREVYDHTVVAPASSIGERNHDTWVSTKLRARLLEGRGFSQHAVKAVTERGVVYLMGMVTKQEGEAVALVASQTSGVQKVVTLFEYINPIQ